MNKLEWLIKTALVELFKECRWLLSAQTTGFVPNQQLCVWSELKFFLSTIPQETIITFIVEMSFRFRKVIRFEDLFGKKIGGEAKRIFISMRPGDLFRSFQEIKARYIRENFEANLKTFNF